MSRQTVLVEEPKLIVARSIEKLHLHEMKDYQISRCIDISEGMETGRLSVYIVFYHLHLISHTNLFVKHCLDERRATKMSCVTQHIKGCQAATRDV